MATRKFHKNLEKLKGVVSMNFTDYESSEYIYNSVTGEWVDTTNLSNFDLFELLTDDIEL